MEKFLFKKDGKDNDLIANRIINFIKLNYSEEDYILMFHSPTTGWVRITEFEISSSEKITYSYLEKDGKFILHINTPGTEEALEITDGCKVQITKGGLTGKDWFNFIEEDGTSKILGLHLP